MRSIFRRIRRLYRRLIRLFRREREMRQVAEASLAASNARITELRRDYDGCAPRGILAASSREMGAGIRRPAACPRRPGHGLASQPFYGEAQPRLLLGP